MKLREKTFIIGGAHTSFIGKFHPDFVNVEILGACEERDQELVRKLLEQHAIKTGSTVAKRLHQGWPITLRQMMRVAPKA